MSVYTTLEAHAQVILSEKPPHIIATIEVNSVLIILGHGPFSHLYDKLVMEVENKDKPDCRKVM